MDHRQALLVPALVALGEHDELQFDDRLLHRAERGEHPGDRSRPGVRVVRQQARTGLGDVEHDAAGLEQHQVAFLVGRDLAEGMKRPVRRLLHLGEGDQADVIRLADLLERPAHAHVAGQALATIGRGLEGGDGGLQERCGGVHGDDLQGLASHRGRAARVASDTAVRFFPSPAASSGKGGDILKSNWPKLFPQAVASS